MRIKIDKTDKLFSQLIKERDKRCQNCGKIETKLENSHFWSRGNKATRYSPMNCDLLCFYCHLKWEGNKQGEYREWKLKQLGKKKYKWLEKRARSTVHCGAHEKKLIHHYLKTYGLKGLEEYLRKILI